jgi:hypothetical protein
MFSSCRMRRERAGGEARKRREDFVSDLRPAKRLRFVVVRVDVGDDRGPQLLHVVVRAAAERVLREQPKKRSTRFSQDACVGVKWRWKRGCRRSQRFTAGVLCVDELSRMTCTSSSSRNLSFRARIVLRCASGEPNVDVARALRTTNQTVGKWRKRFIEQRLDRLYDEPRPGAERTITDDRSSVPPHRDVRADTWLTDVLSPCRDRAWPRGERARETSSGAGRLVDAHHRSPLR